VNTLLNEQLSALTQREATTQASQARLARLVTSERRATRSVASGVLRRLVPAPRAAPLAEPR
jgi:hypothetical protein